MRFQKSPRYEFTDTPRKRAALARKQRKERDALPLFAEQIADEQLPADEIMAKRAEQSARLQASDRQRQANHWRRARQRLAAYPDAVRAALLAYWRRCGWPGTATYLLSMLHMYDRGRLEAVPNPDAD